MQQNTDFLAEGMKILNEHIKENRRLPAARFCYYFSCVAYIFRNYDLAGDMMEKKWKLENNHYKRNDVFGLACFFDCLISIALALKMKEDKWTNHALECFEEVKKHADRTSHRVLLLEAEMDTLMGKTDNVVSKYNSTIYAARESKHIHEEAIANERAGDFCLSKGDVRASHYHGEACRLYLQWGARGKAALLKRDYSV